MPAVDSEAVLRFIKMRGPVLPAHIAKEINSNLMMAGAVLSEMVSSGKLRVSKLKVGGSPLYYAVGQESRLMGFTQHLNSKERVSYDLLRAQGVLRDSTQDSLTRVTLRAIKDFAIPLTVTNDGGQEIFWKWYQLSDSEAEKRIKWNLGISDEKPSEIGNEEKTEPNEQKFENPIPSHPTATLSAITLSEKEASRGQVTLNSVLLPSAQVSGQEYDDEPQKISPIEPITKIESSQIKPPEESKPSTSTGPESQQKISTVMTPVLVGAKKPKKIDGEMIPVAASTPPVPPSGALFSLEQFSTDPFFQKVSAYFSLNNIVIKNASCTKKGSEYDLVVSMGSHLGPMTVFCRALNKKRISDGDLTSAFVSAQFKHLPGGLLVTGQLTKKAQQLLEGDLKGLSCRTI